MNKRIVILGAGPTGLGAAIRLTQLGHTNWCLIDKNGYTGGLATTFTDPKGFLWDIGGHVIFSHYSYFNDLIDKGLVAYAKQHVELNTGDDLWCVHKRESWIRYDTESWIPYPFQNSFYLINNQKTVQDCFNGLFGIYKTNLVQKPKWNNFHDLILNKFGTGKSWYCCCVKLIHFELFKV